MQNSFDGLADGYQKFRPDYPDTLLGQLRALVPAAAGGTVRRGADIGAGTGISTRAILRALGEGWQITGVEPGDDMRRRASEIAVAGITYVAGSAEALPFEAGSLELVAVGQAIQFFDRPTFYAEVARVLKPTATLAVFQNDRQWQASALLEAYESYVERNHPAYRRNYRDIDIAAELAGLAWAATTNSRQEAWSLDMDSERFVGMTLSRRTMRPPVEKLGEPAVRTALAELAQQFGKGDGTVTIPYVTELYVARKPG